MSSTSMPPPDNTHPTTQEFLHRNATREQNAIDAYDAPSITRSSSSGRVKPGGSGKYKKRKTTKSKKSRKHSRRYMKSRRPKSSRRYRKSRK